MLGGVIPSSPQQVKHPQGPAERARIKACGVSTIELILTLLLLVSVVGSTMYYLRSVLPGLEALALGHYSFETAALAPARLGARVGFAGTVLTDSPDGQTTGDNNIGPGRGVGPRSYYSVFGGKINSVVGFGEEAEGLWRLLSATTALAAGAEESWCLALFDPWQAPVSDSCRVDATHIVPERAQVGPEGNCDLSPEILSCLSEASGPLMRAHRCIDAAEAGLRPLLVGMYSVNSGQVLVDGCTIRTVDLPRSYDIRHLE